MNFEELQNAWAEQPNPAATVDSARLERSVASVVRRRGRLLAWNVGGFALVLLIYPLLSVANFRFLHPASSLLFWANVVLHGIVFVALFGYGVRRLLRHRDSLRQSAASVREHTMQALAMVEAEMRDTRAIAWIVPLAVGLALLSGYANNIGHYTLTRFGQQLAVLGMIIFPIASAVARDYRVNLKPARDHLRSLLAEASE